jgi:hypothetical protein
VDLTIDMYFPSATKSQLYIDFIFSQDMNFTSFDYAAFFTIGISSNDVTYTMAMFNVSLKTFKSYFRIILEPKGYIFLYNATFTVTSREETNTTDYSGKSLPFKASNYLKSQSLSWFLIKGAPFSELEENVMNTFSTLSTKTNNLLTQPYIQEIKKSGVFNLLFSGAQVTSLSVLSNQIQSQNLYEGVRFFAIFVHFDSPNYE